MAEQNTNSPERPTSVIEQQIVEKRVETGADTAAPYERAEVHAAVGEQIKQQVPSYQSPSPAGDVPSWQNPAIAADVQNLVNIAFTDGIQQAITKAMQSDNPAIIDALHDVLADQLYQQLVERHKVEPAP